MECTDQEWYRAPHLLGAWFKLALAGPPAETPFSRLIWQDPNSRQLRSLSLGQPDGAFLSPGEDNSSIPFVRACRRSSASLFASGFFPLQTGILAFLGAPLCLVQGASLHGILAAAAQLLQRLLTLVSTRRLLPATPRCLVTSNSPALSDPSAQPRLRDVLIRLFHLSFRVSL